MNATRMRINGITSVGAAALLALTGAAMGQGEFDRPLGEPRQPAREVAPRKAPQSDQVTSQHFMSVSKIEGDQRYDLEIRDGEITAKVNGREVPEDRIRRDGDRVEILDERGDRLASFVIAMPRLGIDAERPRARGGEGRARGMRPAQPLIVRPAPPVPPAMDEAPPPRVMIGIVMSDVPPALAEHLELEPEAAVMVDRAIEGLPAAQAGVRARDIIVEVDGTRPVCPKMIRDAINQKEPGASVTMTVMRRGQEVPLTLTLEAFDRERMAPGMKHREDAIAAAEEARRLLEGRLGRMEPGNRKNLDALLGGGFDPDQMQRFREALRELDRVPHLGAAPDGFEFFVPMAPRDQRGMTDTLTQLDERMMDMERQMERLAEHMDELREMLRQKRE